MPRPRSTVPTYTLATRRLGGPYYVTYWDGANVRRVPCGTSSRSEAEGFLAAFRAGTVSPPAPENVTVAAILDGYAAARASAKSATLAHDCKTLRRLLGALLPSMLTGDTIAAYQADRRQEGARGASAQYRLRPRPLSDGTLIRELGTLRAALAWAAKQTPPWIDRAPFIPRPEAPPPRDRWITRVEAERLLAAAEAPHVRLFIALALYTAHRTGAVLALTWDRVDLESGTVDLGKGVGKKRRSRRLPINDRLLPILTEAKQAATTQYVVEYRGANVASVKSGFQAACKRARLRDVTPHIMRHTAVTWMVQGNVPFPVIGAYASMSVEMVEKRYGHHSPDWLRQASAALSGPPGFLGGVPRKPDNAS